MFRHIPIRRKLMTVTLLTSGAVLFLTCAAFVTYEVVTLHKGMVRGLFTRADILAANSTAALAFQNSTDATSVLAALKSDPRVITGGIYDLDGRLFARYPADAPTAAFPSAPGPSGSSLFGSADLKVFSPVVQDGRTLGMVYVQSDLTALTDRYKAYAWLAGAVVLVSVGVAWVLALLLQRQISAPILALAETAKVISSRGDYSVRAPALGRDELGLLTEAFNQMLGRIQDQNLALKESESRLQTIIESLGEGLAVSDLNGQVLHYNRAALDLHGFASLGECQLYLNQFADIFELSTPDGTVLPVDQRPLARVLRGETLRNVELRIGATRAGWRKVFSYGGTLIRDAAGRPTMAVVTMSDLTERKQAEEEILALNQDLERRVARRTAQLEAANHELEAFSYSVSHDLRAPLRHIDGFAQLLGKRLDAQLDAESRRFLDTITRSAKRLGALIDELLVFARMGRAELRQAAASPRALVGEILGQLQSETEGRRIDWRVGPLPDVNADPAMLRQVWFNLLHNAVKYTRGRDPAVIEVAYQTNGAGDHVFMVRDNGAGFDMQYADKLFGVFQRLHSNSEFEGTGIGLANVRRIVQRHGGRTWAEGRPGEGAAFYFSLPVAPETGDRGPPPAAPSDSNPTSASHSTHV